jgi:hypothetical protein
MGDSGIRGAACPLRQSGKTGKRDREGRAELVGTFASEVALSNIAMLNNDDVDIAAALDRALGVEAVDQRTRRRVVAIVDVEVLRTELEVGDTTEDDRGVTDVD